MQKFLFHNKAGERSIMAFLVVALLLLPSFTTAQILEQPQTIEEAKTFGTNIARQLPDLMKKVFREEVLPLWQKMGNWVKNLWESTGRAWVQNIIDKVAELLGKEIDKRKPALKEEFEKEKQEVAQELKERTGGLSENLWNRFWNILFERNDKETM